MPVAIAKPLIIPRLPEFCRAYPDVEVVLGVSDQPADLLAEGIDCVLRLGDFSNSTMVSRVVAYAKMVICASPAYLTRHGIPETIADLSRHMAVMYFSGRGRSVINWHLTDNGSDRTVEMRPSVLVNDTEALVSCAIAGLGLIQAVGVSVAECLSSGRLVKVTAGKGMAQRPLSIVYPNRRHLAPQVRAFIDWINYLLQSERSPWIRKR